MDLISAEVEQNETTEDTQQIVSESSNIMGELVTNNVIENQDGNYEFYIPDEWIGKVSCFKYQSQTIIHHVTQDESQMELNPILLNINTAPSDEQIEGEVFKQVDEISYYTIARYDFPYTQESADAIEFEQFYEKISLVLESFKLVDGSNTQMEIEVQTNNTSEFSKQDANISEIYLEEKKQDILEIIGQPINIEEIIFEATGETREIYTYNFGELVFFQDELVVAIIDSQRIAGPRGIKVGIQLENVVEMFATDTEISDDYTTVFYRGNTGSQNSIPVPPYCILYSGGETKTLALSCFVNESEVQGMTNEQLEQEAPFLEQYTCSFQFDENDVLVSYSISAGVPSE